MTVDHREKAFEDAVVDALTVIRGEVSLEAPDAATTYLPGGYYRRRLKNMTGRVVLSPGT